MVLVLPQQNLDILDGVRLRHQLLHHIQCPRNSDLQISA